jgi:hypothetical protein
VVLEGARGEQGADAACAAKLRGDVDAGEFARRVQAETAGGHSVGAQDEKERKAGAPELVEGLVDLLLGSSLRWK